MAWRSLTVLEKDSSTGIFLQILCSFKERTPKFFYIELLLATFFCMMILLLLILLLSLLLLILLLLLLLLLLFLQINEVCSLRSICLVK